MNVKRRNAFLKGSFAFGDASRIDKDDLKLLSFFHAKQTEHKYDRWLFVIHFNETRKRICLCRERQEEDQKLSEVKNIVSFKAAMLAAFLLYVTKFVSLDSVKNLVTFPME
jgi:hypothetical protein